MNQVLYLIRYFNFYIALFKKKCSGGLKVKTY